MVKTLLIVIGVFFFLLLAHKADAQQAVGLADASASLALTNATASAAAAIAAGAVAVPSAQEATLVDGSEAFTIQAKFGWKPTSGKCQCPPPRYYACNHLPCRRMMCSIFCPWQFPYWKTCLYCSECEASSAGFIPHWHCWYV
eukprot:TRINITY_DN569_c0_g1_i1.p4 TRINITY_DN569_c0_g1~~TRINITY_DN569_c0_g1_i1.p4  ORF type:complete len:143 (+),score=23.41 TRINITY_DN569_c0_g1_i1:410-838(+)